MIAVLGMLINFASGVFIVFAFSHFDDYSWSLLTKFFNVFPSIISFCFIVDALRRLKQVAKGCLCIETWQMAWHIWSYGFIIVAAIFLSVTTVHAFEHTFWFYLTYGIVVILLFFCELPFLFILNRLAT